MSFHFVKQQIFRAVCIALLQHGTQALIKQTALQYIALFVEQRNRLFGFDEQHFPQKTGHILDLTHQIIIRRHTGPPFGWACRCPARAATPARGRHRPNIHPGGRFFRAGT